MNCNRTGSMLNIEENILLACNEVGLVSTEIALECFDTDGLPIVGGGIKRPMVRLTLSDTYIKP